ncbi:calcitonin gene-related peptide type 1 receptor-like [Pollicipes pollicipes]|uniref:calcitonin gene-related peptide type 1 receptor-like n=1 Tax=Pollicipes pollicipes TaxID=41117 RepID=UPI0018854202|nr:calcitonin gene-related peptide type 1 receptor-like [Pollicipes pollicipes]
MRHAAADAQDGWCPPTWDGWQCWESAPPDTVATATCPTYAYLKTPSCDHYATKRCEQTGHWFTSIDQLNRTQERSDYTSCSQVSTLLSRVYVHVSAYAVSIVALVPALVIFFSYRQLKVHRVSIHKNFFVSLLLNSVMVIVFKCVVMLDELSQSGSPSILEKNGVGCKILFIMTKYCRLTNYLWQFCESYYLHKLIASAFAEQRSLLIFYIIGWVFPVIPVAVYAALRAHHADEQCWVVPVEMYEWVLNAPCLLSLVMCALFLINIIRVLVTKLRAQHANEPSQYRRAVRATLVLVPLFGLHLIVTIYRPARGTCTWMQLYYYADYMLDGLQGALVALIFCYLNGEVQNLLRNTYGRYVNLHAPVFRSGHRSSSLSCRSQHTMHTMVGIESTSMSAAVAESGPSGAAPLLPPNGADERECRL